MLSMASALSRAALAAAISLDVRRTARRESPGLKASSSTEVVVRGANNRVRLTRLPSLKVVGPNNTVVVTKGMTKVVVRGANNHIRVHRRA